MTGRYLFSWSLCAASLLAAGVLWADGGKIKVSLKDADGRVINGSIKAKTGGTTKSCETAAGTCTLGGLAAGAWSVTAYSPSGKPVGGPADAAVKEDKTVNLNILVRAASSSASALKTGEGASEGSPATVVKSAGKGRNLAVGKEKSASGAIRDTGGHLLNGKIIVKQGKKEIGYSRTAAGSYRVYDLAEGEYVFVFATESGGKAAAKVTIEKKKHKTINIRVMK